MPLVRGTLRASSLPTRLLVGQVCAERRRDALRSRLLAVPPGEVVLTQGVADFRHERPAWWLYMVSNVKSALYEALDEQDSIALRDAYEEFFAIEPSRPVTPDRTAQRLQAVLRHWEPLRSVRYLFKTRGVALTLEELMVASNDWAMEAWCPEGGTSVRARIETATERMARATREDCIEAILRQIPRALTFARGLQHRDVVASPAFQRQRLALLDPRAFERVSAACTSDLLGLLMAWDRQLG